MRGLVYVLCKSSSPLALTAWFDYHMSGACRASDMNLIHKPFSLAAALAALVPHANLISPAVAARVEVLAPVVPSVGEANLRAQAGDLSANRLVAVGDDILAFLVTELEDGTVVAQHRSHYSHRSHSSHRSHYSSR